MLLNAADTTHKRIYGLDIVRAVAILSVVYGHGLNILPEVWQTKAGLFSFDGVTVFFVLSGFLIGTILIKTLETEGANFSTHFSFMYKRWFRTLPLYYLILGFLIVYNSVTHGFNFKEIAQYLTFTQNVNVPHPEFFPEAWSLAVEEWFYLLVPFSTFILVRFTKLKPQQSVQLVIIVTIMLIPAFRYYKSQVITISSIVDWDVNIRKQVVTRLDSIVFGLLGAYISYYYHSYWLRWKKTSLALGLIVFLFVCYSPYILEQLGGVDGVFYSVFSFTILSFGVLLTLPFLSTLRKGKGYIYKIITYISLISYSMYLVHLVVVQVIAIPLTIKYLPSIVLGWWIPYLKYALYWFYSVTLSFLLYSFFEKPTMKLRDKFVPAKKKRVTPIFSEEQKSFA